MGADVFVEKILDQALFYFQQLKTWQMQYTSFVSNAVRKAQSKHMTEEERQRIVHKAGIEAKELLGEPDYAAAAKNGYYRESHVKGGLFRNIGLNWLHIAKDLGTTERVSKHILEATYNAVSEPIANTIMIGGDILYRLSQIPIIELQTQVKQAFATSAVRNDSEFIQAYEQLMRVIELAMSLDSDLLLWI